MAAGHAERVSRETGKRVVILDKGGKPRWHEVWEGNPAIVRQPEADTVSIRNASGCRPYIRYPWVERCRFTDWRARDHVGRSEEHTSELQSLMSTSYADFCLKKQTQHHH